MDKQSDETDASRSVSWLNGPAIRLLKSLFLPIAISALVYFGWGARDHLRQVIYDARPDLLGAAIFLWVLMHLMAPLFALAIFRGRGHALSYRAAAEIHNANLPARYLPGGIWHSVGRVFGFRDLGIGRQELTVFVFLENVLAVTLAGLIGTVLLLLARGLEDWGLVALAGAISCVVILLAIPWFLKTRFLDGATDIRSRGLIQCVLLVALSWCVAAASFVCFYFAFPFEAASASIIEVAGAYLVSWAAGFVAVFSPQGIGIFEIVAAELLRGGQPIGATAVLFAGFRLVILAADIIVWSASRILNRTLRH